MFRCPGEVTAASRLAQLKEEPQYRPSSPRVSRRLPRRPSGDRSVGRVSESVTALARRGTECGSHRRRWLPGRVCGPNHTLIHRARRSTARHPPSRRGAPRVMLRPGTIYRTPIPRSRCAATCGSSSLPGTNGSARDAVWCTGARSCLARYSRPDTSCTATRQARRGRRDDRWHMPIGSGPSRARPTACARRRVRQRLAAARVAARAARRRATRHRPVAREQYYARAAGIDAQAATVDSYRAAADLVICVNVLEHTEDPPRFLHHLAGATDDGDVIVVCPDGRRPSYGSR